MSLEMVSSIERLFASGDFPIWRGADRPSQEQALQFANHHFSRGVAVKQGQQLIFQGVVGIGSIELFGMLVRGHALLHRDLRRPSQRSEEHTSELQSQSNLVCRLLLEKKKKKKKPLTPQQKKKKTRQTKK